MELNEIINPYFSFPVVGVVICALLVYAFGFKSPVQPPSFDFDDDRKSSPGSKKRKVTKKTLTNGHVPTVTATTNQTTKTAVANVDSRATKPSTKVKAQSAINNSSSNQNNDVESSKGASSRNKVSAEKKSDKGKREKNNEKASDSTEAPVTAEKNPAEKHGDEGEWVQSLSRKGKKNRKREELIEDAVVAVAKGAKQAISNSPIKSKENTSSKKKQPVNKNEADKNAINKAKIMQEKLDDNIEKKSDVKSDSKPPPKSDDVILTKTGVTDTADVAIPNGISAPKKKKGKNTDENVPKEPAQIKKEPVKESKKEPGKEVKKEPVKESKKEPAKEVKKEPAKEVKKEPAKEVKKEPAKEVKKEPAKEVKKEPPKKVKKEPEEVKKETTPKKPSSPPPAITSLPSVIAVKEEPDKNVEVQTGKIAFDELGDAWVETKNQKKKKKTRRDQ